MHAWEFVAAVSMNLYRTPARLLDVVQDVYLQVWKSFERFETGTNCRAWIFKILLLTLHHYPS
jgi:RNA polymerase sigma-70 factor (ECF subfamily)